jgi:hypothetical protein
MFRLLEIFERTGITRLATSYLGEVPLISVNKCTLRKVEPYTIVGRDQKPASAWHQDGAFLGEVRALNVWVALSHCGDDAPGLDLVPKRLDYIVPTGTEGAEYDWSLSLAEVDKAAGETGTARPIFEAGDVMLFDEMFLHSTATEPDMPHTRFAAETWFFGPSKFPDKYTPVSV